VSRDRRYTAILENSIDLITFVDPAGRILFDSPSIERLLGVLPAERLGRSMFELIHPEDLPWAKAAVATAMALRKGTPFIELRLRHKDGRWRVFESAGSPSTSSPWRVEGRRSASRCRWRAGSTSRNSRCSQPGSVTASP
jgi:PAS domain S-box-containing protein